MGLSINDVTVFYVEGVRNCVKFDLSLRRRKKGSDMGGTGGTGVKTMGEGNGRGIVMLFMDRP